MLIHALWGGWGGEGLASAPRASMWNLAKSGTKVIRVQSWLQGLIWGSPRVSMLSRNVCLNRLPDDESAVSTTNSVEKMLASLAPAHGPHGCRAHRRRRRAIASAGWESAGRWWCGSAP